MKLSRLFTEQVFPIDSIYPRHSTYIEPPDPAGVEKFAVKVESALNKGWKLHGSPALAYDASGNFYKAAQSIEKHEDGEYVGFVSMKDMPASETLPNMSQLYRFLVDTDDSYFCSIIEQKLNEGWELWGDPVLVHVNEFGNSSFTAGQAIIRTLPVPYAGFTPLRCLG